jgi:hypothetical protein
MNIEDIIENAREHPLEAMLLPIAIIIGVALYFWLKSQFGI